MLGIIYKSRSAKTYFQRVTPNRSEGVFGIKEKRKRNINIDPLWTIYKKFSGKEFKQKNQSTNKTNKNVIKESGDKPHVKWKRFEFFFFTSCTNPDSDRPGKCGKLGKVDELKITSRK